ncbi:MAG: hypothetical protein JEZ11_07360 [Desulfobacterales bacterium]|nr:hypothetical protein [Desulfobacterales bacterium]
MDIFDLRETLIPFSLLQVTNTFKKMSPGNVMEIVAGDAGIVADLARILPAAEYDIVLNEPMDDLGRSIRLRLKKRPTNSTREESSCPTSI